ncbi:MAG: acetate--CoA ligase family protein [Phycisphaerae bacterium]|nr:acetate--CoA ligase family protein [Phycisphaerae bacterium]
MIATCEDVDQILTTAAAEQRSLYEHEGYAVVEAFNLANTPAHVFVPRAEEGTADSLAGISSQRVVLKIVSPDITHKTEAGGVAFALNNLDEVRTAVRRIYDATGRVSSNLTGVLICECVERASDALGRELFVGLRMTREFGPVLTAGFGGTDTELLAQAIKPGQASSTASALLSSPQDFFELFKQTLCYTYVSGSARGKKRLVADDALLRCFEGFIELARRHCAGDATPGPAIEEFEINPLMVEGNKLTALDAVCRFGRRIVGRSPRPIAKIEKLLRPRSMAIVGVSGKTVNMGRIILRNVRKCGFDTDHLYLIKPGEKLVDETPCVAGFAELPEKVDLIVVAIGADQTPQCIRDIIRHDAADAVIVIPGGMGETEGGAEIERTVKQEITTAHQRPGGGPVFVGGNCLGVQSQPGKYDTFFIPPNKLKARLADTPRKLACISQSGAFLITRMSNVGCLDPAYAVTMGNQIDLTVSDCLEFLADNPDIDTYAIYLEGLIDLNGVKLARAIENLVEKGKTPIVYKAGRTAAGRTATQGHTSVIAGDYAVCAAVLHNAGALVAETFRQFEQLVELSCTLHHKQVNGMGLGVVTNAGFESVGMADATSGPGYSLKVPALGADNEVRLRAALKQFRLDTLVNPRNPLDLTPMANDEAYETCVRIMLEADSIDAVVVSLVPLTPAIKTTPEEIAQGRTIAHRLADLHAASPKPLVAVLDSGSIYEALAADIRAQGLTVFRSADQAVRSLGTYLAYRSKR